MDSHRTAWLAGITDADGCLSSGTRPGGSPWWAFRIAMTCKDTVDVCSDVLDELGVRHSCRISTPGSPISKAEHVYAVSVTSIDGIRTLCKALLPYSVTKKALMERCLKEYEGRKPRVTYVAHKVKKGKKK